MTDNNGGYFFDIKPSQNSIIKVIGVGGGGSNAVNHMYNQGIRDVEFYVCNTDVQALQTSPVPNKIQIGVNLTSGLGAGANPEKGKNAALEDKEHIREFLGDGTKMVFITAGMGGGTGTGAAPIIAKVARELDILTVGIVTAPFSFEGKKKMKVAQDGIEELKSCCDTVLVILNDKLREIYGNLTIMNAFAQADNILTTAAKSIAEIITVPGYVNVDFEDVKTVMMCAGTAVMGSATVSGEDRARKAAEAAISSPLLDNKDIHGAQRILLSIMSGEQAELQINELSEITDFIQEMAGDDADMIFGHGIDPNLGENISVTVITTGFDHANDDSVATIHEEEAKKQVFHLERPLDGTGKQKTMPTPPINQPGLFDDGVQREEPSKKEAEGMFVYQNEESESEDHSEQEDPDQKVNVPNEEQGKIPDEVTFLNADKPYEFFDRLESENKAEEEKKPQGHDLVNELEDKKNALLRQSRDRIEKLKSVKQHNVSDEDFKEKWDVPAYVRKKVDLKDVPHSSEKNISKFNLNDDNMILGNNKFLHDNVD